MFYTQQCNLRNSTKQQNSLPFLLVQCNLPFLSTPNRSQRHLTVAAVWKAQSSELWGQAVMSRFNLVKASCADGNFLFCLNPNQATNLPKTLKQISQENKWRHCTQLQPLGHWGMCLLSLWSLKIAGHSLDQPYLKCPIYPAPGWVVPLQRRIRPRPWLESSWPFILENSEIIYQQIKQSLKSSPFYLLEGLFR